MRMHELRAESNHLPDHENFVLPQECLLYHQIDARALRERRASHGRQQAPQQLLGLVALLRALPTFHRLPGRGERSVRGLDRSTWPHLQGQEGEGAALQDLPIQLPKDQQVQRRGPWLQAH